MSDNNCLIEKEVSFLSPFLLCLTIDPPTAPVIMSNNELFNFSASPEAPTSPEAPGSPTGPELSEKHHLLIIDDSGSDSSGSEENCNISIPIMEPIMPYKQVRLPPSCFINGCICGHNFEFRDMAYEIKKRRNTRCPGITIKPKVPAITAKLRN